MAATVNEIQQAVAAVVDLDQDTANISTADYALRIDYMNRRERKWAEITDWQVLFTEYATQTSLNSGNVTVALPTQWRKPAGYPVITYDGVDTKQFTEIQKQEEGQYTSTDKYVYYGGDPSGTQVMVVHPGTSSGFLASGASIYIPYFKSPASLSTSTSKITCPNPDYIIRGVIADVWEAREDARFEIAKAEANEILRNMLERENTPSIAASNRHIKSIDQTRFSHRWGK